MLSNKNLWELALILSGLPKLAVGFFFLYIILKTLKNNYSIVREGGRDDSGLVFVMLLAAG